MFRNIPHLNGDEMLTSCPTLKLEDHPLSAFHDTLFIIFAATIHVEAFLHQQAEDAPCRGGRDPLFTDYYINKSHVHHYMRR